MTVELMQPLELSVQVPVAPARAFELFTSDLGRWWPLLTHSIGQTNAVNCAAEQWVGGGLYEEQADGTRMPWGRVLVWEPPHRVVYSWHPGMEESEAQQVEVCFKALIEGSEVVLRHYGWEAAGEKAAAVREGYANGWQVVFRALFVEAARKEANG